MCDVDAGTRCSFTINSYHETARTFDLSGTWLSTGHTEAQSHLPPHPVSWRMIGSTPIDIFLDQVDTKVDK